MLNGSTKQSTAVYAIAAISLVGACVLTFISYLQLCSQACAEGHNYRLFGFPFETVGLVLFPLTTFMHLLSRRFPQLTLLTGWMLCAMLGSEIIFIYVQKYKIGSWCPVCLSIAAVLTVAALAYLYDYYKSFKLSLENPERGPIMINVYKGLTGFGFFFIGLLVAFGGIAKYNPLEAAENKIQDSIAFGNPNSHVEVYVFTDWNCPACRSIEPMLESIAPKIMKEARLIFVDDPVHPETMNFTPYNVSFMANNKDKYFQLRNKLIELSEETKTPTEEQVTALAAKLGVKYKQLNYADVALANKYFSHLINQLEVEGTPTVVIVNKETQKGKKLGGASKITEENIMKNIQTISKAANKKK
ncbi:MAG TPA: thioredoxin domain-containing protein [Parachlamydiaceae bacterium]|nr:thioredoxin domain-containing protein [Parachlamydiaceae bacterium]